VIDPAIGSVVVEDLEKVYVDPRTAEEVVAVRGLDLRIAANEFVSIIGPSGCGKTTFLHLLAGLRKYTGGRIFVHGKPVTRPGADRGMVFQDYALFPWKTARENVEFGLKIKGVRAA
jgi:NitT/TauT family transport system ATP-binding protein